MRRSDFSAPTLLSSILIGLTLTACGPAAGGGGGGAGGGTSGGEGDTVAVDAPGGADDISALMVDVVAPHLCEQMRGSFVGLPGDDGHSGAEAGTDPLVGRWWIRECTAQVTGNELSLSIAGTGWTWIDRESMGFRIRQYLRFDSHAAFHATMEVAYDREARIATIWMRARDVDAGVEARGLVRAEATGMVSDMLGGLLELTGSSVSDRARQQVAEEGSARLRERFSSGFTVTFALDTEQMDFMVGALPRGVQPLRPWAAEEGVIWSVNERTMIWPGGVDVLGPIAPGQGQQALDLEVEEGEGIAVEAVCAEAFSAFYDQILQGATPPPPHGRRVVVQEHAGTQRVLLPPVECPTLLLLMPRDDAQIPVRARARITRADAPTETARAAAAAAVAASGGTGTTTTTAPPPRVRPLRIQLVTLSVTPTSADGARWDTIGSEPDPYIIIVSVPGQREIERTAVVADQHELRLDHWLPGAFRPADLPLRFSVYDDDIGSDELIGVADLVASQLSGEAGEIVVEIRTQETVPRRTGVLRLRVTPSE